MEKLISKLREEYESNHDLPIKLSKWYRDVMFEFIIKTLKEYKTRELAKHGL